MKSTKSTKSGFGGIREALFKNKDGRVVILGCIADVASRKGLAFSEVYPLIHYLERCSDSNASLLAAGFASGLSSFEVVGTLIKMYSEEK